MSSSLMGHIRHRLVAACLLAASLPLPAIAGAAQAASDAPASLRLASAPVARSAQSDCTREASSRGWTIVDTRNMRQAGDGWTMDITVRDRRGRTAEGSCFVETRTGDVTLFGLGWGDEPTGDSVEFKCASVDSKYRECQLPIDGRVELVKKLSDASCKQDKDWGKRGDRVWVNHGCRAKFRHPQRFRWQRRIGWRWLRWQRRYGWRPRLQCKSRAGNLSARSRAARLQGSRSDRRIRGSWRLSRPAPRAQGRRHALRAVHLQHGIPPGALRSCQLDTGPRHDRLFKSSWSHAVSSGRALPDCPRWNRVDRRRDPLHGNGGRHECDIFSG